MPTGKQYQATSYVPREQRHRDCSDDPPDKQCMPFPLPDVPDEEPRMVAKMFNLTPVQRKTTRVKEMYAQIDEWDKQNQMKGRNHM
jgi:hypothetical protein